MPDERRYDGIFKSYHGGLLMTLAKVIKFGKALCPVSVDICDRNGTAVAVAQITYMRLSAA